MNWYCINTRPAKENKTATFLEKTLGLATYSPRIIQLKLMRGSMSEAAGPLFPRYLFCRLDLATQFNAVRHAPEVIDFVRCGNEPAVVSEAMIVQLKNWAGEGVDVVDFQPGYHGGARVEITHGPMKALPETILESGNDRERVAVLLSVLENKVPDAADISRQQSSLKP